MVERNLIVGNKEGFQFREQNRKTPEIIGEGKFGTNGVEIWNHDEIIRNNTMAFNRLAQVWGWFDVHDGRHWPAAMQSEMKSNVVQNLVQTVREIKRDGVFKANGDTVPADLTLEKLNIRIDGNLYWADPGQGLFNWGTTWMKHRIYDSLETLRRELGFEASGVVVKPLFADFDSLDLRVPSNSLLLKMKCYPEGDVPGVKMGIR